MASITQLCQHVKQVYCARAGKPDSQDSSRQQHHDQPGAAPGELQVWLGWGRGLSSTQCTVHRDLACAEDCMSHTHGFAGGRAPSESMSTR
jgi:hypothetical protein